MAFDLHITAPDHSPVAQAIQRVSEARHISPQQAVAELLDEAAMQHGKKSSGAELLGLFSSDEDAALINEVGEMASERCKLDDPRDFGL